MADDTPGPVPAGGPEGGQIDDSGLLAIIEAAIADERAAQEKYRAGLARCADPEACRMFEQLLREEEAHERALGARYAEVKKRIGLSGRAPGLT